MHYILEQPICTCATESQSGGRAELPRRQHGSLYESRYRPIGLTTFGIKGSEIRKWPNAIAVRTCSGSCSRKLRFFFLPTSGAPMSSRQRAITSIKWTPKPYLSMQRFVRIWQRTQVHTPKAVHRPYFHRFATMSGAAETDDQAANVANSSGVTSSSLKSTLTERLEAEYVDVEDISGMWYLAISKHTNHILFRFGNEMLTTSLAYQADAVNHLKRESSRHCLKKRPRSRAIAS